MVFPIAGGTQDTGYEISNSLRFNDDDDPYLARTPSSSGSRTKATVSFWVKRGNLAASGNHYILEASSSTSPFNMTRVRFGDDLLIIDNTLNGNAGNGFYFQSVREYRDPLAWYHIFFSVDVTQANATDGWKLYVNGVQQTRALDFWVQNANLEWSQSGVQMNIGRRHDNGTEHLDGYLTEFHYIDGTIKSYTDFGEFNNNGVWIPKKYDGGSYGTNGFYMEFQQTGTSANSSGMGADTSGNDNHFTPNNLTATDVTTDTCTNNFATINSLIRPYSGESTSEGNVKSTATHAGVSGSFWGTIPLTNGKWYWESKITTLRNAHWIGVSDNLEIAGLGTTASAARSYGIFYKNNGKKSIDETESNYGDTYAQGDIIGVALDMDNKNIYFSKNGTFQNSGDPTSGSTGTGKANSSALEDIVLPACMQDNGDATVTEWNFGNPSFSISSSNADANGYGNFEYSVPSGYYAICTKNLAEFG